ncbi:MAG: 50S ribosomal protein L4 [Candidatus Blackburnbacteria bacterium]|nr:50S ribosomal protein L4 [Candidatus Blackburnbacteria bacterium]
MAAKRHKTVRGLIIPVYTADGTKSGTMTLPERIFGQKPNSDLLAQAVRVYLANQRTAGAKAKGRGEVRATTRKVYRQKGTGGARHGAQSAPIYVGGGVAHGPKGTRPRLFFPQKMRRLALVHALSSKLAGKEFFVADIEKIEPKTKKIAVLLEKLGIKGATMVHEGTGNLFRAARNIEGVLPIPASQLSAYHVLAGKNVLLTKEAVKTLESRFAPGKKERENE